MNEIKEQEEIVVKYEMGREEGAEIDEWEDPSFEVYHVTDHYGFMHNEKIPEQIAKSNPKLIEKTFNREKKWLTMTKDSSQWNKAVRSNKVTDRTYKGIPERVRGNAWCLMLDVKNVREKNKGVYEKMRDLSKKWSTFVKQIDLDINRTFRDHIMFRKRYDIKQQELFNVLCAYSLYDEDVGYCQGMSEVAALFLMFMNEEDAFWCFATMMTDKKHNMRGFFLPSFPKLMRFKDHHDEIMRKHLKKVKKHLDKNNIHTISFCIKWFMQCFLDRVPFSLALRFWDIYIWEGEGILVAAAYTVIRIQRDRILKLNDEEMLKLFQSDLAEDFGCSDEVVVRTLKLSMAELKQSNKLIPKIPQDSVDVVTKELASFAPPETIEVSRGDSQPVTRSSALNGAAGLTNSTRVSIPADGGPILGVDLLIKENEGGWGTSLDRFLSQECFDELTDKSDNSPILRIKQQADDGLSSCTSLASHDYDNSSFYEGDDDLSIKKDGRGSPDTLNGSNDATHVHEDNDDNGDHAIEDFGEIHDKNSRKSTKQRFLLPSTNVYTSSRANSDPECLYPNGKSFIQDALAFYKTVPTVTGTNHSSKIKSGVPYNPTTNHIASLDPSTNHKMPYSQSSGNVGKSSSPGIPEIKLHPQHQVSQSIPSSTSSRPPMYSTFRKNALNSSYLGKKVQLKNVQRDQQMNQPQVSQGVSVVMIGEDKDVIICSNQRATIIPPNIRKSSLQNQLQPSKDGIQHHGFKSESREASNTLKNSATSNTANVSDERLSYHRSTSQENSKLRHFVSSKPLIDTGLYHPDYRGVTRIWTGSPVSSVRSNKPAQAVLLNQREHISNVYSNPPNKPDNKGPQSFYTRF